MKYKFIILILIFSLLDGLNAQSDGLSLEKVIKIGLENNKLLKSKNATLNSAKSQVRTAYELPKLDFNAQFGQYNSVKYDNAFQIAQSLPFPGLIKAKKNWLVKDIEGYEWAKLVTENELKAELRRAYFSLEYLQFKELKLQQLDSLYGDYIRIADLRYNVGEAKQIETNAAKLRQMENKMELQNTGAEISLYISRLMTLMGGSEVVSVPKDTEYLPNDFVLVEDSLSTNKHPWVMSYLHSISMANLSKKLEKAKTLPDIKLGYSNQSLIGFQTIEGEERYFDGSKRFHVFNVGLAIPLFNMTKPKLQALEFQRESANQMALHTSQNLKNRLSSLKFQHQNYLHQYQSYRDEALPSLKKSIDQVHLSYSKGESNYMEYLQMIQTKSDLEMKYLETIYQINLTIIDIQSILNQ
jgi:cobalt-zinc-cadmium resistance protein CzcA